MRLVITGADGFIGKNLRLRQQEMGGHEVVGLTRATSASQLVAALQAAEFVFHVAELVAAEQGGLACNTPALPARGSVLPASQVPYSAVSALAAHQR